MRKTKKIRFWDKSTLAAVLFLAGIGLSFLYAVMPVYKIAEKFFWDVLCATIQERVSPDQKEDPLALTTKDIGVYGYAFYSLPDMNRQAGAFSAFKEAGVEKADLVERILYLPVIFGAICFTIYFIRVLQAMKKEILEKRKRLEMLLYMYDVETLLFSVCLQNTDSCVQALQRIAKMVDSQGAFFKVFAKLGADKVYMWCPEPTQRCALYAVLEKNRFYIQPTSNGAASEIVQYDRGEERQSIPDRWRALREVNLSNFLEVPVKDERGGLIGMLGVFNMGKNQEASAALENVTRSFRIWYWDLERFERAKEMREIDSLTGLHNRNCYQNSLERYRNNRGNSVACIYLDANALHVLNNQYGHEAGDKMLQSIAKMLCTYFCKKDVYRIGGDEFIVFVIGEAEHATLSKLKYIENELTKKGYSVSAGMQWISAIDSPKTLEMLIKRAEQKMYAHKQKYYAAMGKTCCKRQSWMGVPRSEYRYADAE